MKDFEDYFYAFVYGGFVCRRCGAVCGDWAVHHEWHKKEDSSVVK